MYPKKNRRGLSPVISSIILAAAVLTVGASVWHFSLGYCSVTTDSYITDTLELMNVAIERFTIEKVTSISATKIDIWINNYGEVDIIIDLYAYSTNKTTSTFNIEVPTEKLKRIELDFTSDPLEEGDNVQIKIYSRRQNVVYTQFTYH